MSPGDQLFQHFTNNKNSKSMVFFKGKLAQDTLGELGGMIKSSYSQEGNKNIKRIFAVFIELAQNILHYSEERIQNSDGTNSGAGIVMLTEEDDGFHLTSGNLMRSENSEKISSHLDHIKTLAADELKSYYQEMRKKPRPEDSKGAGLGFIDIARKADRPLDYKIKDVDDENSYLTLSVYFKKDK